MYLCAFPLRYLTFMVFSTTDLNDEEEGGKFRKSNVLMLKKKIFSKLNLLNLIWENPKSFGIFLKSNLVSPKC